VIGDHAKAIILSAVSHYMSKMRTLVVGLYVVLACACPDGLAQDSSTEDAAKLVELDAIKIVGTRLPVPSVIRLTGLKIGDKVNDLIVNTACHKITATGLVKKIDYAYDLYPDKPGVALTLTLLDEGPLLSARILPADQDERLWQSLVAFDPLFDRRLPRTEKALAFYAANIEKVLKQQGRENEYAAPTVTGDANGEAREIVFQIREYKQQIQKRK